MKRLPAWWPVLPVALGVWLGGLALAVMLRGPERASRVFVAFTHIPFATPTPPASPTPVPTSTPTPTPVPAYVRQGFRVGVYVQVAHTKGARLRIREAPGLHAAVRFLAYEGELFRIAEGPVARDGYLWWYVVAPYSTQRAGWAAQDYLQPLPQTSTGP